MNLTIIATASMTILGSAGAVSALVPHSEPQSTKFVQNSPAVVASPRSGLESLVVYYSPLKSTKVTRDVGFGMAYHMAIVYTDRSGTSYCASSGPSNSKAAQTPQNALRALYSLAEDAPSSFGTLASDPHNNTPFVFGSKGDCYTRDAKGRPYINATMMTGHDLSAKWTTILQTYAAVGRLGLTYSPTMQNSNSMAGTALRRVGLDPRFSSRRAFVPGVFTELPFATD